MKGVLKRFYISIDSTNTYNFSIFCKSTYCLCRWKESYRTCYCKYGKIHSRPWLYFSAYIGGDTGATVITRMIDENLGKGSYEYTVSIGNQLGESFYLTSVKDKDHREAKIPEYILKECDEQYGRDREDWLGEFDYTFISGWMYAVNNWFQNYWAG